MTTYKQNTAREVIKMALIYALQDRRAMLSGLEKDDEYHQQVQDEITDFKRMYRFRGYDKEGA